MSQSFRELFCESENQTKVIIDEVLEKNGIPTTRNIPTSEQYNDLVPVTKGKLTSEYCQFLIEKYGSKWVIANVFFGNMEEVKAFKLNFDCEFDEIVEEQELDIGLKSEETEIIKINEIKEFEPVGRSESKPDNASIVSALENKGLGESYSYKNDGLRHIFLMYAKGVIPQLTPEQFSLVYLELYGKILPMKTCIEMTDQINKQKKHQVNSLFTEQVGDSTLVKNGLLYIKSKALKEGWTEEKLAEETKAFRSFAKKLENEIGVTAGRAWVHDDANISKQSAVKKTFNFLSKKFQKMVEGTVNDIADIDAVSTKKIKIEKD